jgi:hypothetical protein
MGRKRRPSAASLLLDRAIICGKPKRDAMRRVKINKKLQIHAHALAELAQPLA